MLLVGTTNGIYTVTNGQIRSIGRAGQSVRRIIRHGTALLAAGDGGLSCSRDGGCTWAAAGLADRTLWEIAVSPHDPALWYAGGQPAALYRTADAGRTWTEIDALRRVPDAERWLYPIGNQGSRARTLDLDPADPRRIAVGVEVGGIYTSADGGATWTGQEPDGNPDVHLLVRHPIEPNVLFLTAGYGRIDPSEPPEQRLSGAYRSDDAGRTWRRLWDATKPRYTVPICVDPRPPHALTVAAAPTPFAVYSDEGGAGAMLYQSDDGGDTWRVLGDADHAPSTANLTALAPDPATPGGVLAGTDSGEVWRISPDAVWMRLAAGLPPVQTLLALDDSSSRTPG